VTDPAAGPSDSETTATLAQWAADDRRPLATIARNVTTRYLAIAAEMIIGLVMLPFNLHHLGKDAYGLWMLTGSLTIHFSVLDLGYGGALTKFMAQYRAHRNARALNEIASTLFFVFAAIGVLAYLVAMVLAFNLEHIFRLDAAQAETGKWILLTVGLTIAMNFPFSVYGGVISGFQRYDANNMVAIGSSITVALVNVVVLTSGYGLITLVISTTAVRMLAYFIYRRNAYRIYPALSIKWSLFRRDRLKEATSFSVYASIIDWANKLNYELDEVVIGAFMGSGPVAVWAVADRIISGVQRLTNQLNGVLFPVIVESDATNRIARLQKLLVEGTRLSLATVAPIAVMLIMLAHPLVHAWVGDKMIESAVVIQILAVAVALRVGNATGTTLLKGSGQVRYLAFVNIATGVVNLLLSALLIRAFGLVGVAAGTLAPIAFSSIFVLFPASVRRVDMTVGQGFRRAVWPAVWPAFVAGLLLAVTRNISSGTLLAVLLQSVAAAALYYALFFGIAIGRRDRQEYVDRLMKLLGKNKRLAPAA
jgi:O-antigen/teichoic acid export membrane protein